MAQHVLDDDLRRFGRLLHYGGVLVTVVCATVGLFAAARADGARHLRDVDADRGSNAERGECAADPRPASKSIEQAGATSSGGSRTCRAACRTTPTRASS